MEHAPPLILRIINWRVDQIKILFVVLAPSMKPPDGEWQTLIKCQPVANNVCGVLLLVHRMFEICVAVVVRTRCILQVNKEFPASFFCFVVCFACRHKIKTQRARVRFSHNSVLLCALASHKPTVCCDSFHGKVCHSHSLEERESLPACVPAWTQHFGT